MNGKDNDCDWEISTLGVKAKSEIGMKEWVFVWHLFVLLCQRVLVLVVVVVVVVVAVVRVRLVVLVVP